MSPCQIVLERCRAMSHVMYFIQNTVCPKASGYRIYKGIDSIRGNLTRPRFPSYPKYLRPLSPSNHGKSISNALIHRICLLYYRPAIMIVVHLDVSPDVDLIPKLIIMIIITLSVIIRLRGLCRPRRGREGSSVRILRWTKMLPLVWCLFAISHIALAAARFAPPKVVRPQLLDIESFQSRNGRGDNSSQIFHRTPDPQIDDDPRQIGQSSSFKNFHRYNGTHNYANTAEVAKAHQNTDSEFPLLQDLHVP